MTFEKDIATSIEELGLLRPGERVLVAFSGGADSTALALLLLELGYDVVLGHVDHGIRPDSAADARHCRWIADSLGCPFHVRRVRVDPPTQAEARRARYRALEQMARQAGATAIATGHTRDDQAETVQLRLRRGGLGLGIPPRRGNIVRPLLGLRRSQTERVCREAGLCWLIDPSNQDERYARVRVRDELARDGSERVNELAATAERTAAQVRLIQEKVDEVWRELVRVECEPELVMVSRTELASLERVVAKQLVRRVVEAFGIDPSGRVIDDVLEKVVPRTGARLAVAKDVWVWSERADIVAGTWSAPPPLPPVPLPRSGVTLSRQWGLECHVREVPAPPTVTTSSHEALIDAAAVDGPLCLRPWMPGDRFHPLGAPGSKKLQDFFVDQKVARRHRHTVPIVQAGSRIAWVVGHRIDEGFKLTEASSTALHLQVNLLPKGT